VARPHLEVADIFRDRGDAWRQANRGRVSLDQLKAAREAELLPVPYFHVVFTLPSAIGDIAYQNKAVIYDRW
jgi:hypothetical protein